MSATIETLRDEYRTQIITLQAKLDVSPSKKPTSPITSKDWVDMADRFESLNIVARAEMSSFNGRRLWSLRDEQSRALCELAGARLLLSPRVIARMPDEMLTDEPLRRWLQYVTKNTNQTTTSDPVVVPMDDGTKEVVFTLSIDDVNKVSKLVCIKCAGLETNPL